MVKQHVAVNTQPASQNEMATHYDMTLEEMTQRASSNWSIQHYTNASSQTCITTHKTEPSSPTLMEEHHFSFRYLKTNVLLNAYAASKSATLAITNLTFNRKPEQGKQCCHVVPSTLL